MDHSSRPPTALLPPSASHVQPSPSSYAYPPNPPNPSQPLPPPPVPPPPLQVLDSANHFIKVYTLPDEMAQRIREFLHQRKALELRAHASRATLPTLSPALQIEAIMHIHAHWVKAIWFVQSLEEICQVRPPQRRPGAAR